MGSLSPFTIGSNAQIRYTAEREQARKLADWSAVPFTMAEFVRRISVQVYKREMQT